MPELRPTVRGTDNDGRVRQRTQASLSPVQLAQGHPGFQQRCRHRVQQGPARVTALCARRWSGLLPFVGRLTE